MNKRWLLAVTAAVGVGLLAVPLLLTRTPEPVGVEAEVPAISDKTGPVCRTSSQSMLDFTLKDVNGAPARLNDYKGKVVLVNFWATWCGPCKVEIPEFVEVYSRYKDQGFVILGVLANDTPAPAELQTFMSEYKMTYPVLFSNDEIEAAYGSVWALPTSFLIGRDGAVCAKQMGPASQADVERSVKALL